MPESAFTLCQSQLYPPVRDFGFGLSVQNLLSSNINLSPCLSHIFNYTFYSTAFVHVPWTNYLGIKFKTRNMPRSITFPNIWAQIEQYALCNEVNYKARLHSVHVQPPHITQSDCLLKGTVSRDFLLLVFFMNQFPSAKLPSVSTTALVSTTPTANFLSVSLVLLIQMANLPPVYLREFSKIFETALMV